MTAPAWLAAEVVHPSSMWRRFDEQARFTLNEVAKGLRLLRRRWPMFVTAVIANAVLYLGMSLFIGAGHIVKPVVTLTLPALAAAAFATIAAVQGSGGIAEEINGGTFEQSELSPAPAALRVLGRLGALGVEGLAAAVLLGILFAVSFGLRYRLHAAVLIPAVLTVIDALGYGLVLIALTIRVSSIGAITHVFNMGVEFFGGMLVPVTVFPHGLETFARFVPITLGVEVVNSALAGAPLSVAWHDGTLPWLIVHATASLALGFALFAAGVRRARRQAGFG